MEIGYMSGMKLGGGFHTATYDNRPVPALDEVVVTTLEPAGGQQVFYDAKVVSSSLSFTEQLNVSASASLRYGISGSGSAKTSFLSSFQQNSFTVYVVVQVIVTNAQKLLDLSKARLKLEAAELFVSDPQAFAQQYGDSFIYGLTTGGVFLGVLEMESSSAAEFKQIQASLSGKANYGLISGSAQANFGQALQSITSSYQSKATILRQGGSGALNETTPEQLIKDALAFPEKVAGDKGFPYEVSLISYNNIPHPPSPSALDVSNQATILERLGDLRRKFLKYQNDLMFALEHQDQFPGIDIDRVNDRSKKINSEIAKIVSAARTCYGNQTRCEFPEIDLTLLAENVLPPQLEGATKETMISGTFYKSYFGTNHPLQSGTTGPRSDTVHVDFPGGKFNTIPKVQVMFNNFDTDKNTNLRLSVSATNITAQGFDAVISTYFDSKVYGVGFAWFAHAE